MEQVLGAKAPEVFTIAARAGVAGVEIYWETLDEARPGGRLGPECRAALRAAAQRAGIDIPSVCAGFLNAIGSLAHPDASRRQVGLDAVHLGARLCQDLGARVLLLPFFAHGAIVDADGAERLIQHLRVLAPQAEDAGVTLGIEHTLPAEEAVAIIEAVGSPRVREYWDMANAACLGYDPVQQVRLLGPLLIQVHAKEYDAGGGPPATRLAPRFDGLNARPLGAGSVPLREVLTSLQQVGYDGYIVLETGTFGEAVTSTQADLECLRAALAPH
jgi:sugar phosphate isomerase/epimerase